MSALKMRVHNLNEVKALIKEAYSHGNEIEFDAVPWESHTGEKLCTSLIRFTDFELILPDRSSVTVEVL